MRSENVGFWNEYVPLANFVTSGKILSSSVPQLPYRSNADGNIPYTMELLVRVHEMMHEKLLA